MEPGFLNMGFEEYAQWILNKWLKLPGNLTHLSCFLFSSHLFSFFPCTGIFSALKVPWKVQVGDGFLEIFFFQK